MTIKDQVNELNEIISEATQLLCDLRVGCQHREGTYAYGGNTGNYDPSNDSYLRVYQCQDCGKNMDRI